MWVSRYGGEWLWVSGWRIRLRQTRHVRYRASIGSVGLKLTGVGLGIGKRRSRNTAIDRGERLLLIRNGGCSSLRSLRLYHCQLQSYVRVDGITYESSGCSRLSGTGGGDIAAATSSKCLSALGPVFSQSLLKIRSSLKLRLLSGLSISGSASGRVSSDGLSLQLGLLELRGNTLLVSLEHIIGDTLHAKDFHIEAHSIGQRIVHFGKLFLVDLTQMDGETWSRVSLAWVS